MRRRGQHCHHGEQMRHVWSQRIDLPKSSGGNYQGLGSERGRDFVNGRDEEHRRSERDGSSMTMANQRMLNEGKF